MNVSRKPLEEKPPRLGSLARLPVFLALDNKRAVVAGGSPAAAWKAELLSASGALVDVYAATIPTLKFEPVVHVNYAETVLPMKDGLPKLKDFPAELGGSGEAVPE